MTDPGSIDHGAKQRDPSGRDPMRNPDVWVPRLARILDEQRELYSALAALAADQTRLIETDDTDSLLELLGRRQTLIEHIARTNQEMAPFTQGWDRLAPTLPEKHRSSLRARFDEVARLVERISEQDDADRRRLEVRRARIGQEIEGVSRGRGALAAYTRPAEPGPAFQDSRG